MRAYLVAFASVLTIAAATPAAAEGFRAEIHGGWDRASVADYEDDGIIYGVGLGYDVDLGSNTFVGVDLSLDDSTQKECETSVIVASDRLCTKAGRDLAAGVRVGMNVSESGKIYALGAYPMPVSALPIPTPPAPRATPATSTVSGSAQAISTRWRATPTASSNIAIPTMNPMSSGTRCWSASA